MADDGLPIRRNRARKAERFIALWGERLGEGMVMDIASEIGLGACLSYAPDPEDDDNTILEMELTDLQMVSLASAMAAMAEFRGMLHA